jgi:DNA-binding PadR family transcriptional regulator
MALGIIDVRRCRAGFHRRTAFTWHGQVLTARERLIANRWTENLSREYHYRMAITNSDKISRDFFVGFIRLHILYHASIEPIFGLDMIRELETHGYRLSPGTLYPILHSLEKEKYLTCQQEIVKGKVRKYYRATAKGREVLTEATEKVKKLIEEIIL